MNSRIGFSFCVHLCGVVIAAAAQAAPSKPVLADVEMLERVGAEVLAIEPSTGVGFARLRPDQEEKISALAHERGRCGGFEALDFPRAGGETLLLTHVFGQLAEQEAKNRRFIPSTHAFAQVRSRPDIEAAMNEVSEANLRATVEFMSSFPHRDHRQAAANVPMQALKDRIDGMLKGTGLNYQIELLSHRSTKQNSIRVRIPGRLRPSEIVVLGGHADSINWSSTTAAAPGVDDNASGSANLIEALRILAKRPQPERTIEFFWYAGEEGGLLGSAEIAKEYKAQAKDVVGVMQLDMTLFPGSGEFVIGSVSDYTNAWLRSYLLTINSMYVKANIVDDKCGYACSDHASWHRQGYAAIAPFESSTVMMNRNLHTTRDVIDQFSNFRHSAAFTKLALAMAMDLGNSTLRQ